MFIPAAMGPFLQPVNSAIEVMISIATSVLSVSWYFVWYGSMVFAFRGRFPILSARAFSVLLGVVYAGFAIVSHLVNEQLTRQLFASSAVYFFAFCAILSLSGFGAVFLTGQMVQNERELERLAQERDRRLDALHPWGSSDAQGATLETDKE